jgi:hypothetical protein
MGCPPRNRATPRKFLRLLAYQSLRAAGIGDEGIPVGRFRDLGQRVDSSSDGQRDVDKVSPANCRCDIARTFADRPTGHRARQHIRLVESNDARGRELAPQRKPKRPPDQPRPENGQAMKFRMGCHASGV